MLGSIRGRLALLVVLALAVSMSAQDAWATTSHAASSAPAGAGYVVSAAGLHRAQVTVRVPKVACGKHRSASVAVGLFGYLRAGSTKSSWSLTATAACTHGSAVYRAVHRDRDGRTVLLRLRPGDRVRLIQSSPSEYEADDLTTGEGAGGAAGEPGAQPVFALSLLIGIRVGGSVSRSLTARLSGARDNGRAVNRVSHHRRRQVRDGRTVAKPSRLRAHGSFMVTVAS